MIGFSLHKGDTFTREGKTHRITGLIWGGENGELVVKSYQLDDKLELHPANKIEKYFENNKPNQ